MMKHEVARWWRMATKAEPKWDQDRTKVRPRLNQSATKIEPKSNQDYTEVQPRPNQSSTMTKPKFNHDQTKVQPGVKSHGRSIQSLTPSKTLNVSINVLESLQSEDQNWQFLKIMNCRAASTHRPEQKFYRSGGNRNLQKSEGCDPDPHL